MAKELTYDEWVEEVGIFKDEESREAWDYQQEIIDELNSNIEKLTNEISKIID